MSKLIVTTVRFRRDQIKDAKKYKINISAASREYLDQRIAHEKAGKEASHAKK